MSKHKMISVSKEYILVLIILVTDPPFSDAKGVRSPTPTDEYLASFFDPSSEDGEMDVEVAVETMDCEPGECETTTAPRVWQAIPMMTTPEMNISGRDGIVNHVQMLAQEVEAGNSEDELEKKITKLESRVSDLERSSSKLKKLALAAMSVALADEGDTCSEAEVLGVHNLMKGFPAMTASSAKSTPTSTQPHHPEPQPPPSIPSLHQLCDGLGTPTKPALSCNQLKLVCNKASGHYFIHNGYFTQVECEMDLFGGGWARYGQAGKQNVWNYVDEDRVEVTLQIMQPAEIKEMIDMKYNTFKIHTDVTFSLQADDSTNPSRIHARSLPWFNRAPFYIDGFGENFTRLEFLPGGNRITCRNTPGTSHKCGWGEVPRPNESSEQVLIESVYFAPRSTSNGAMTYTGDWQANRYTWSGSYYYVYAK